MKLKFKNLIIHNFLSYGHAEIDLENKNYCLVSGVNHNPKDNAVSNGAGKSSWTSAICFALTGETIQGLSSNLKNINIDEDLCYVSLDFMADKDNFVITRYKNPKSDLKIIMNGQDISGKGIRDSEQILAKYLPDLTSQLISSIIILGQGLPNKFTANTPSGRKDVLEKLSKSDFMIQDVKDRVNKRSLELNSELRTYEDSLLKKNTEKEILFNQLNSKKLELEEFNKPKTFDEDIINLENQINNYKTIIDNDSKFITELDSQITENNNKLNEIIQKNSIIINNENNNFNEKKNKYITEQATLNADIRTLNSKITQIKAIKDICPTCGQRLPNVVKPNTEKEEEEIKKLNESLTKSNNTLNFITKEHNTLISELNLETEKESSDIRFKLKQLLEKSNGYKTDINSKQYSLNNAQNSLIKIKTEKENFETNKAKCLESINSFQKSIENIETEILYIINKRDDVSSHIKVVNQINTLIKRDFRGYLLSNIIDYISVRAKSYSRDVFGTDEFTFALDGNNIDIAYCNKSFENLSGGEKQKADLIVQFAIRDMMQQYLGFTSNILVLDEIFDALDMIGCTNVLNLISNKLNDLDSIFIISHRSDELSIPYDTQFIVTKNEQGVSSIVCQ